MQRRPSGRGLRATLTAVAVGATALATSTSALAATAKTTCTSTAHGAARVGHISGVVSAVTVGTGCQALSSRSLSGARGAGDTANGTPPLIWHNGPVMGTSSTGPMVITPIFWNPSGYPMDASYKRLIVRYLFDVARASARNDNVYSIATEYYGTNGGIQYQARLGKPINDTGPLPTSGCTVLPADNSGIYADNSGYSACIDDNQVIAETDRVVSAKGLPRNLSHIYVLFLPKHVESCFNAGDTSTAANECTINHEPSAAYCAYHSYSPSSTVYANMPFPVYKSSTGYTCGSDVNYPGVIQTPNNNPDADTEISPTSHEIIEAWTDPDTETGWYDSSGYEIGDECAYVYGPTSGSPGAYYNQTINRQHYFTQEEFSNDSYFMSGGGCLQGEGGA